MFNKLIYNFNESFKNLWRNRTMTIASIASVTSTLLILGIIFTIILNVNLIVANNQEKFDEIVVYLKEPSYDEAEIKKIIQNFDKAKQENENNVEDTDNADNTENTDSTESTGGVSESVDNIGQNKDDVSIRINEYKSKVNKDYESSIQSLKEDIKRIIGVKEVKYFSKDENFDEWKKQWGDSSYLLDGISENPLPNSLIIELKDLNFSRNVVSILNSFEEVEDIRFDQKIITTVVEISNIIKSVGFILIFILLGITMFMITNTIKIAVNTRYREINIMKYVGATNWFIRWPFIIEGMMMGMIGAVLAAIIMFFSYGYAYEYITSNEMLSLVGGLLSKEIIILDILFIYIVLGVGVGALGSIIAVRKHLKV